MTAATGHEKLLNCLASVQQQTYQNVEHIVVIDGEERADKVQAAALRLDSRYRPLHVVCWPHPTGRDKWNGHRIYAAASYLSNSAYIAFLDEDNWLDADHIESLLAAVRAAQAQWAFSLRKIFDTSGNFVTLDNCENLGNLHPVYFNKTRFHVDTNCYLLPRELAVRFSQAWYRPAQARNRRGPDSVLCQLLLKHCPQVCSNRRHTLNYTVGNRPDSVRAEFFLRGNQVMRDAYPHGLPWEKPFNP